MADDTFDLSKVVKKVNDTYALLASLSMAHEMLRSWSNDSFNECIQKIASGSAETATKIDGVLEKISKAFQEITQLRREVDNKFIPLSNEIKNLKDQINQILSEFKDLKTANESADKKIYALHTTTNLSLNANLKAMKADLETRIANIPFPQDTVNIAQVKDQIYQSVEPVSRETKTATANINAHSMKFTLLEKRVEMALAQLKILEQK